MTGLRRWIGASALALTVALGGCAGGGEPEQDLEGATTTATPAPAPAEEDGSQDLVPAPSAGPESHIDVEDTPGSLEGFVGALADAEVTSFEQSEGEWLAEGTVTNPLEAAVFYRIYVSAMGEGATTTRGVVQVDVPDVAAGDSAAWRASFPLDDDGLSVVLRVERAAAEK